MSDDPASLSSPRSIGLIGGTGGMGRMFRRLFEADGYRVEGLGRAPLEAYERLVRASDVIIVSVPIQQTVPLIRSIAPFLRPGQLLSDFTSIKAEPLAAMLETEADVIGCHPIFAPMAEVAGQNVVLCPVRPGGWLPWYRELYAAHGLRVAEMTPEAHDQAMGFIQGLTHFLNIAFASTLRSAGGDLEQLLQVCSPVYRVFFAMLCRILSGDAELYGQIQITNPASGPLVREFLANGQRLLHMIEAHELDDFYGAFRDAAAYLGDYRDVARAESDYLIEQFKAYPPPQK